MDFQEKEAHEVWKGIGMEDQIPVRETGPIMAGWNLLLDMFSALEEKLDDIQADSQATHQMIKDLIMVVASTQHTATQEENVLHCNSSFMPFQIWIHH